MDITFARSEEEIKLCFPVIKQLRFHITDEQEFHSRVLLQIKEGYNLVYLKDRDVVQSAAGFRLGNFLAWGKILYVDDLVSLESSRSKGYGKKLFDWLVKFAQMKKCNELHLDSGVQRFGAHRFYLNNRMDITSHHFALKLNSIKEAR